MELVNSFTRSRFPICLISPMKNLQKYDIFGKI